jgi:dihydroorotase
VASLDKDINPSQAIRVINVAGKIITPGLIDDHVHCYHNMFEMCLPPDRAGVYNGVTTVVDAADAGAGTLFGFRKFIVEPSKTNVYCLLNIAFAGMIYQPEPDQPLEGRWSEIDSWDDINAELTVKKAVENRDVVLGIKLRAFGKLIESKGIEPVELAKKIAVAAQLPLVVHIGAMQGTVPEDLAPRILNLLDKGDILCHLYTNKRGRVIELGKPIMKELRNAKERGVIFDMCHGWFNFGFETARYGIAEGIVPDIISSDLAIPNVFGPVYGLCETMSKMMAVGLNLDQVVKMTTTNPAQALNIADRHGSLKPGRVADISVLELLRTEHTFTDSYGGTLKGEDLLLPIFTIRSGKRVA